MAASQKNEKEIQTQTVLTESKVAEQATEIQEKAKAEKTPANVKHVKSVTEKSIKGKESVYAVEEFVTNAESLFQRKPECVRAALMEKGIEKCTKSEAQKIVAEFMKKEVR